MSRVLCILNPKSRDGRARDLWPVVQQALAQEGLAGELLELGSEELAVSLEHRLLDGEGWTAVLGIGGDGTHMSIVNALKQFEDGHPGQALPPYICAPLGTGNNLAKSLDLRPGAKALPEAAALAASGQQRSIDLGLWEGRRFAGALSIGIEAEALRWRHRQQERGGLRPQGYLLYIVACLRTLARESRWQAKIAVDGQPWYDGPLSSLVINNAPIYAGEFHVTPAARLDDELLDAVVFAGVPQYVWGFLRSFRHFPAPLGRRPGNGALPTKQGRRFEVQLDRPAGIQLDGECFPPADYCEVAVDPGALRVMAPESSPTEER